ncbi:MAG: hypothetical protein ACOX7U_02245 [Desulfitobacteriia bacterium]|jgi:hypothetical protein
MDFLTFIVIALFVYGIMSRKDKAPKRHQSPPPGKKPRPTASVPRSRPSGQTSKTTPQRKKGSVFQSIDRQLREAAEKFERELQGGRPKQPTARMSPKREEVPPVKSPKRKPEREQKREVYQAGVEESIKPGLKTAEPSPESPPAPKISKPILQLTPTGIRQGIIWAEVLKEPRGRKRFYSLPRENY